MLGVTSDGQIITIENEMLKNCCLVAIVLNDGEEKDFKLLDSKTGVMAAHHLHKLDLKMQVVINQDIKQSVVEKFINNRKLDIVKDIIKNNHSLISQSLHNKEARLKLLLAYINDSSRWYSYDEMVMRDAQGNPYEMARMIREDYAALPNFKEKMLIDANK